MSVINTNIKALAAQESMRSSNLNMSQAMERLSTGKKINSAKDDAAGLSISNRMTSQIRGIAKAIQNANDGVSMTQTAEGAYGNVSDILQRMRELAVQGATGTNSSSDRQSLQLEITQLKSQIDDIAAKTNHNNIKLLDGSASNINIQANTKANDTLSLSFDSVKTKDIGIGSRASISSVGGNVTSMLTLSAGTLLLNGVSVGASSAVDDNASTSDAAKSAIAKAAAINRVASLSGVYAKADSTVVSGQTMSVAAASSVTVTINGVATDTFTTGTDYSLNRKLIALAINAKSAQTGVTATDTESDTTGITLTAADGRNVAFTTTSTASGTLLGMAASTISVGSFSLYTLDSKAIQVDTATGVEGQNAIAASGLRVGTYSSDQATLISRLRTAGADSTAPSSTSTGVLDSSTMIINGVSIGQALNTDDTASDTTASSSTRAASAIAIAAAINRQTNLTGVKAVAQANVIRGTGFTATTASVTTLFVNNTSISVNTTTRNGVIDSLNAYSSQTGVVASAFGEGVQLTAADGRNISLATKSSGANTGFGLTGITVAAAADAATTGVSATTYYSQVTLVSDNKFTVQAGKTGTSNLELLGFRQGNFGGSDNGLKINQVDISTQAGASQALTAIDVALETVSKSQSKAGAVMNRLDMVINNLTESSQNLQASKSRIMDTDYAVETTNLAKQQIISQAATAMLAQANQQGQAVLSLLK